MKITKLYLLAAFAYLRSVHDRVLAAGEVEEKRRRRPIMRERLNQVVTKITVPSVEDAQIDLARAQMRLHTAVKRAAV